MTTTTAYPRNSVVQVAGKAPKFPGAVVTILRYSDDSHYVMVELTSERGNTGWIDPGTISHVVQLPDRSDEKPQGVMLYVPARPGRDRAAERMPDKHLPVPARLLEGESADDERSTVPTLQPITAAATTTETLKGLNPMVRAERLESYMREHDASAAAAAAHFGIPTQSVYTFRQPLNFPDAVKAQLRSGALSFEQAIAVVRRIRRGETVTLAPVSAEADRRPVAAPALPEPVVVEPVPVVREDTPADDLDTLDWEPYQNTRGELPHSTQPMVSIRKDGSVFLNKELMVALGQPTYLCLAYHRDRRLLRLTPSEGGVGAVRISADKRRQGAATITIKGFFLRFAVALPTASVKVDASVCGGSAIVALEWS